jgi:hypothetical protein
MVVLGKWMVVDIVIISVDAVNMEKYMSGVRMSLHKIQSTL